ncbi:MAG: hypothetical protein ABII12_15090 [Planctomycetota bacterium]
MSTLTRVRPKQARRTLRRAFVLVHWFFRSLGTARSPTRRRPAAPLYVPPACYYVD